MVKVKMPKLDKAGFKHLNEIYTKKSEMYDKLTKFEDYNNDIIKTISKMVDFKDKVVLDLGAGTGKAAIPLSRKAKLVYALDYSKSMLKILRRKIKAKKIKNIKILEQDYSKLSLPKESVDVIVSLWSFPAHCKKWDTNLEKVKRVLKKGGKIFLVDLYHRGEFRKIQKRAKNPKDFLRFYKFNIDMHKWFASKGFRNKIINILVNFRLKKNVEHVCGQFFGNDMALYLLARGKTNFNMKVSIFYWKK